MCKAWNGLMGTDKVSMLGKLAFWNESLPPTGEASLGRVQIGELIRTNLTSIPITHFTVTCSVRGISFLVSQRTWGSTACFQ